MPPAFLSRAPELVRLPIVVNVRAISLSEGMRAGLSVAVIIALNEYREFPALREAALAALLTCICDPGGPIRRRIPVLRSVAVPPATRSRRRVPPSWTPFAPAARPASAPPRRSSGWKQRTRFSAA